MLKTFDFDETQAATAFLYDQDNFRIPSNLFPVVIEKFVNPSVYIKIVFNVHEHTGVDMVFITQ